MSQQHFHQRFNIDIGIEKAQQRFVNRILTGVESLFPWIENFKMIGVLRFPTLVVQEGGYDTRVLGSNARHFLTGLWVGAYKS